MFYVIFASNFQMLGSTFTLKLQGNHLQRALDCLSQMCQASSA